MNTENLSTLKIHKLTKDQYNREFAAGRIDENALYLTPSEETDLSLYATTEYVDTSLADKADATHSHNEDYYTKAEVDVMSAKVDTLVGSDENKSVRAIANEELAKQLIVDNAAESMDTLAEIAAWIQSHPDDASAMNEAIIALQNKTALGTYVDGNGTKEYATVKAYVEAHMAEINTKIDEEIDKKVDKVDGKGLSSNDLTDELKGNYDAAYAHSQDGHAPVNAQENIIEGVTVNGEALTVNNKTVNITVPTDNAQLTNSAGYLVADDIADLASQSSVDELSSYVGTFTASGDVKTVVDYVNAKTSNIASNEMIGSLAGRIDVVEDELDNKADVDHNHDSAYDAKGSASAVQSNLNTVSDTLGEHTGNEDIHVTTSNKTNWNTAYTHSQSAHARVDATKVADSTTNGNILINGTETNVYSHPSSGVAAGTYKSVTVNAQGHITAGTNPTTLAGYGITDAESKGAANSALASAKEYTDTVAAGKSNTNHNHDSSYDKKGSADSALASAKTYADSVKNELLNGAGSAYDTLKELGDLITDNQDAIDALEIVASGKADKTHGHAIADVSGLQSALDGKAASSHGTHVSYSTTAPVMDGTASVGTASTVARSDHKHPTDTSRASKTEFDTHAADATKHITSTERTNWNAAYTHSTVAHAPSNAQANQNAFSNIAVSGQTTVAADTTTDTVTFVGSNVSITTDATNDKITFTVADGSTSAKGVVQLTNSTSSTSTTTAATPSSVKTAYDLANTAKTNASTAQTKADSAYSLADSKAGSLSDLGVTTTATELNYVKGVTSGIQAQLDNKATSGHTHNYAGSSSAGGAATSANKVNKSLTVQLNGGTTEGTNKFTFDGSTAKNMNITASAIGAAVSSHSHDDKYYTETEIDAKVSTLNTAINGKAASSHTHAIADVTNLQATLDGKAAASHTHDYAASSHTHSAYANQNAFSNVTVGSTTIAADTTTDTLTLVAGSNVTLTPDATNDKITISVPTASGTDAGVTIVYPSASCTTFSSDSGTITPLAAQKAAKMFAITRPTSSTNKAITRYSNTTGDVQDSKIIIEDVTNTKDSSKKAQVIAIPAEGGKKMVYGYCTDQVDGTSFIGGVFDSSATSYPYSAGLAIGGTSGNLLWKGRQVATTDMIPSLSGYVPTSRTVNGKALSSNINLTAADVGAPSTTNQMTNHPVVPLANATTLPNGGYFVAGHVLPDGTTVSADNTVNTFTWSSTNFQGNMDVIFRYFEILYGGNTWMFRYPLANGTGLVESIHNKIYEDTGIVTSGYIDLVIEKISIAGFRLFVYPQNYSNHIFTCKYRVNGNTGNFYETCSYGSYKCNPNILVNWYFANPVNQRGLSEYINGAKIYTIDDWYKTASMKVNTTNNGLTITNVSSSSRNSFIQILDTPIPAGTRLTLSCLTTDGTLYTGSGNMPEYGGNYQTFFTMADGTVGRVYTANDDGTPDRVMLYMPASSTIEIVAMKLEVGELQTLVYRRGDAWILCEIPSYNEELVKCQRYYQLFSGADKIPTALADYRPNMRATPATGTVTINGTTYYYADASL